jgi:hypothetical protein
MKKKVGPETYPTDYMASTASMYVEKIWSRAFPYNLYVACTAYISEKKRWSRAFPFSFYMPCTAYLYDGKNMVPRLPQYSTWPVHPIYTMNNVSFGTSPTVPTWPEELIIMI